MSDVGGYLVAAGKGGGTVTLQVTSRLRFHAAGIHAPKILQQAWVDLSDGSIVWKDVPLHIEAPS